MSTSRGFACRRFFVSGRVQGVFFRASTARRARELGVRGRAVNLADGRVEVLAVAEPGALDALEAWLHEGPPAARVDAVEATRETLPDPMPEGFATG